MVCGTQTVWGGGSVTVKPHMDRAGNGQERMRVVDYFRLMRVFLRISFQDDAAYRGEFWTRLLTVFYSLATVAVGLWIFFSKTDQIAGWSLDEVIVLIGTFHIVGGVVRTVFAPNFERIVEQVRDGTLDFLLTKPGSSQFLATFRRIRLSAGLECVMGALVVVWGISRLTEVNGVYAAIAFPFALFCGLTILYSFWVFIITFVFWFVRFDNVTQIFWSLFEAGRYPLEIYPGWLRVMLTYLIPVAVITTFPAQGIAGRLSWLSLLGYAAGALIALVASSKFWRFGIRHYTSASS